MAAKQQKAETEPLEDLVDGLIREWREQAPDVSVDAMGIVGRIQYLGNLYEGYANKALKPYKIKFTDFDVLGTLRRSGAPYQLSPTQLCETVLITSGAMTAALDRLEKAGFILRALDPVDRRVRVAGLTRKGVEISELAANARFKAAEAALEGLDKDDREALAWLLRKLIMSSEA